MTSQVGSRSPDELRDEIIRLGPWHLNVEIAPGVATSMFLEAPPDTYPRSLGRPEFVAKGREFFHDLITRIYGSGLAGRSVLDCACNCGGYLFWAKEMGAGDCTGFDVREHWIRQARFLVENRVGPGKDIRFEVCDLYDLPSLDVPVHDVTLFNGIFYHLPDPILGLRIAAERTRELIMINTATHPDFPDGVLVAGRESKVGIMSGVHGLHWLPSGPGALEQILEWLGFPSTRTVFWTRKRPERRGRGRMMVVASRDPALLKDFKPRIARARPRWGGSRRTEAPSNG